MALSKKALSAPMLMSPASTVATEADYISPHSERSERSDSEKSFLPTPLLNCENRLYDELPGDGYSRFRFGVSPRFCGRLALFAAFAFGLLAGGLFGFNFGALTAFYKHPRLRGAGWWDKRGIVPGTRMELVVQNRSVLVYMPWSAITGPKPTPLPAVVVLHGSLATAPSIADQSRFEEVAEARNPGFLIVYPEMKHYKALSWGFSEPDEVAFFKELPNAIAEAGFPIDQEKVFVAGHSNGGTMSLFLQNNLPDVFKGAAAVEAGVGHLDAWQNASFGRPTMVVWNHNDNVLAKYGGESLYQETLLKLRRHDPSTRFGAAAGPSQFKPISGVSSGVVYANRFYWPAVGNVPPLAVVSWQSDTPTHNWANPYNVPGAFDAASQIWKFFQEIPTDDEVANSK